MAMPPNIAMVAQTAPAARAVKGKIKAGGKADGKPAGNGERFEEVLQTRQSPATPARKNKTDKKAGSKSSDAADQSSQNAKAIVATVVAPVQAAAGDAEKNTSENAATTTETPNVAAAVGTQVAATEQEAAAGIQSQAAKPLAASAGVGQADTKNAQAGLAAPAAGEASALPAAPAENAAGQNAAIIQTAAPDSAEAKADKAAAVKPLAPQAVATAAKVSQTQTAQISGQAAGQASGPAELAADQAEALPQALRQPQALQAYQNVVAAQQAGPMQAHKPALGEATTPDGHKGPAIPGVAANLSAQPGGLFPAVMAAGGVALDGVASARSQTADFDLSAAVNAAPPAAQVAQALANSAVMGEPQMVINLNPPELGRVSISLSSRDGQVEAVLKVENPATLDEIRRERPVLMQALSQAGVQVRHLELQPAGSADLRQQTMDSSGQSPQQSWQQAGQNTFAGRGAEQAGTVSNTQTATTAESGATRQSYASDKSVNLWI